MSRDFGKAKGSNTLKDIANKTALSNANLIKKIEISKIIDNKDNEYLFGMKNTDIEYMAQGIKENGFKGAIEVYDLKDGTYEIYSGHIRKYACLKNGEDKIDCIVYDLPEKESDKRRALIGANIFGRNKVVSSDPVLVARQIEYHKQTLKIESFKGDIRSELAREFGISSSQIYKYLSLLKLNKQLQEMASCDIVSWTALSSAAVLDDNEQERLEIKIGNRLEDGEITREKLQELIDEIKHPEEQQLEGQLNINDIPGILPTTETKEKNINNKDSSIVNTYEGDLDDEEDSNYVEDEIKEYSNAGAGTDILEEKVVLPDEYKVGDKIIAVLDGLDKLLNKDFKFISNNEALPKLKIVRDMIEDVISDIE